MCLTLCLQNPVRFIDNFRTNITRQLIISKLCRNFLQNMYLLKVSTHKRLCVFEEHEYLRKTLSIKRTWHLLERARGSLFTFVLLCLMRYSAIMNHCSSFDEVGPSHKQPSYWQCQCWSKQPSAVVQGWVQAMMGLPWQAKPAPNQALVHPPSY